MSLRAVDLTHIAQGVVAPSLGLDGSAEADENSLDWPSAPGHRDIVAAKTFGSLGRLSRAQLQAAVDRFGLGRVTRAWPLTEGLFGKNVAIDTTSGAWVLRGDPWPSTSDYQYRKEAFFAEAIHEGCSVPAPWPYHVEGQAGLLPWPYALMPRLGPGVDLSDHDLDWMEVAEALGAGLAELHRIRWSGTGEWAPSPAGMAPYDGTAAEWLEARLAAWLFMLSEPLDAASEDLVFSSLRRAQAELDGHGVESTYVHHDYKPTNLCLGRSEAGGLKVVGVFDLNEGYAGDPLEDLPRSLWSVGSGHGAAVAARYLRAYSQASGRRISAPRVLAYTVFDLLIVWEFGSRPQYGWFAKGASFAEWSKAQLGTVARALDKM